MNIKNYIYIIVATLLLIGCNKEGAGCFDKAGSSKTVAVDVVAFKSIDVNANIDIRLLNDGVDKVEITTGENLISGISLVVDKGVLKIDNLNRCFWSIGYTHPLVTIRNAALEKIVQHGYGNVFSTDTLFVNKLILQVEDASGGFNLIVNANDLRVISNSLGSVTLYGRTNNLSAGNYWSDGILYAKDLVTQNCSVQQNGSNRMEINVKQNLSGKITSIGDIYLFGQRPTVIDVEDTGEGKIIEKY